MRSASSHLLLRCAARWPGAAGADAFTAAAAAGATALPRAAAGQSPASDTPSCRLLATKAGGREADGGVGAMVADFNKVRLEKESICFFFLQSRSLLGATTPPQSPTISPHKKKEMADLLGTPPPAGPDASPTTASSSPTTLPPGRLTHVDPATGAAAMVDVSGKAPTVRSATATATVALSRPAFDALAADALAKGDALGVARIAGITGAKRTPDLIPLCHSVPLAHVALDARLDARSATVTLTATASTGPAGTGVEMEALVGASLAALALHDMTKALSPGTVIGPVRLERKVGGKGGAWVRGGDGVDEWRREGGG
jgi:cyclic pyranopterin monophosphate synthase